jgi:hypothetical protein
LDVIEVLSLAHDTDAKQTRNRMQTLLRNCNAAGGRSAPPAIEVFSGAQSQPAPVGDVDGDADVARGRRKCGSGGGTYRELSAPDFSLDAGATVPVEVTGAADPTVPPVSTVW